MDISAALRAHFGFDAFRPGQREAIESLLQKGGIPFPHPFRESPLKLAGWLNEKSSRQTKTPSQMGLF